VLYGFVPDGAICRQQIGVVVSARAIFAEVSGDAGTEVTKIELHRKLADLPAASAGRPQTPTTSSARSCAAEALRVIDSSVLQP
jgi:hypothetical protein